MGMDMGRLESRDVKSRDNVGPRKRRNGRKGNREGQIRE